MSNKNIVLLIVVILIVGGSFYFLSNQKASTPSLEQNNNTPVTTTPKAKSPSVPVAPQVIHNISITGYAFVPSTITVRKGETIVWTNKDTVAHTVTGGDMQSNHLTQNQTYSFAYDRTGTFPYHCSIHPNMKGTIIVTN